MDRDDRESSSGHARLTRTAPLRSRRQVVVGAAAFLGLVLAAGCSAPGTRRCNEMVPSGQHGYRMKRVPCPTQETAP